MIALNYEVEELRLRLAEEGYIFSEVSLKRAYFDGWVDECEYWMLYSHLLDSMR